MKITTHKKFDKAFVKLTVAQRIAVKQAIAAFETNRLDPNLRDHALKGEMKRLRAFSAGWAQPSVLSGRATPINYECSRR